MKKLLILVITVVFLSIAVYAESDFEKQATGNPELIQKGTKKEWCPVCGMNIKMYYKTSHAVVLKNGSTRQYCSIRCLADDFANISGQIKEILVTDAKTEKLINAAKAFYVIGSDVDGTMSAVSKIAFGSKIDAVEFQKEHGGNIADFKAAFAAAKKSLTEDKSMTSMKRQKVVYPIGAKIYKSACKPFDPSNFEHINGMKAYIKNNNICGNITEQQMQAVALYMWDVERVRNEKGYIRIDVPNNEKCPVCGMIVSKYPRWAAKITYKKDKTEKALYFDGVKDMMKFYINSKKFGFKKITIKDIAVTDYYSQKAIDGKKAFYVAGSDVYGPMGNELIPFASEDNAKTFAQDHNGKTIAEFNKINDKLLK